MNSRIPPVDRPTRRMTDLTPMRLLVLLGLAVLLTGAQKPGKLQQTVRGAWPGGSCQTLIAGAVQTEVQELPVGEYLVALSCPTEHGPVVLTDSIRIRAGRTIKKMWRVKPGWLRLMAERDGELLTAEIVLKNGGHEVARRAANAKFRIPVGRYYAEIRPKAGVEAVQRPNLRAGRTVKSVKIVFAPGKLQVRVSANGRRANAIVRVRRKGQRSDVKRGLANESFDLPPGRYQIRVELEDAPDFAFLERDLWVRPRATTRESLEFRRGELVVTVVKDGKQLGSTVRVFREGAGEFFSHFESPGSVSLEPGAYAVEIPSDAKEPIRRDNLKIAPGTATKLHVDISWARLEVQATKNGQLMKDAEIQVRRAGGGAATGVSPDPGKPGHHYRLLPGRYEVAAMLPDGTEQVSAPFVADYTQRFKKVLDFHKLQVQLTAFRNGRAVGNAVVLVFKRGASEAIQQSGSGGSIELEPGTYDLRAIAGPDTAWRQGVRIERNGTYTVEFASESKDDAEPLPEGDDSLPPGDEG